MSSMALAVILSTLAADKPPGPITSPQAKQAVERFAGSVSQVAEDFDKRVRRAREKLIGELAAAASAAVRANDSEEARNIEAYRRRQEIIQRQPTQLPMMAIDATTIIGNSRWLLSNKQIYVFQEDESVIAMSETGQRISDGRWEEVDPRVVKIRFGGFYVGVIDPKGQTMTIIGATSNWEAKLLR